MAADPMNYWEQLERLEKLIRAAELKSGVVFSFHSLILGLAADRLDDLKPVILDSLGLSILTAVWFMSIAVSIYYCFKCFNPQLSQKYERNIFYFRDAIQHFGDAKKFPATLMKVCENEEQLCLQLGEQVFVECSIIDRKFSCVRKSIGFFAFSIGILIFMVAYWLVHI